MNDGWKADIQEKKIGTHTCSVWNGEAGWTWAVETWGGDYVAHGTAETEGAAKAAAEAKAREL